MNRIVECMELEIKNKCKGELTITRYERKRQGVYEFYYMPDKGKIPQRVWINIRKQYLDYYDRETFKYFHKSFTETAIIFECRIKVKEKMLEIIKSEFKKYRGEF
ncbi:hypothetical protein [Clostridium sp.]|uniref:hypothetical protein n=1 Tax=Clostridium sp. TaxID=1506 RepID=UPI00283DB1A0|nr:hypothetical protein [Clostridium sp.]MDR3597689.1 hypothetical protein [Clostridium sp.]